MVRPVQATSVSGDTSSAATATRIDKRLPLGKSFVVDVVHGSGIPGGLTTTRPTAVSGGPLAGGAPDALGDRDQLGRRLRRSVFGAGHPRDGLLHQGAAQVIGPAVEHHLRARHAELDPAGLNLGNAAVQHDSRQRMHRAVIAMGRARTGRAGEIHGELWCTNGSGTNSVKPPVRSWITRNTFRWATQCGGVHVPVHHRRRRPQAHLVRGAHDLDPHRGRQLALGEHPAHFVVENFGGGAGDGAQPGLPQADQPLANTQTRSWSLRWQSPSAKTHAHASTAPGPSPHAPDRHSR